MSADLLRLAAQRMREVAEKAAAQPQTETRAEGVWLNSRFYVTADPVFMLAVADLLDEAPCSCAPCPCCDVVVACGDCDARLAALTVARTYLNHPEASNG